ncbi:hypothetical protein BKA70DRAFT_1421888 [Coprinopsis sp. MPI-PUGE-AT-0042]|nr:hypothetical protein BKA70DRAFT_1421888 [Coprinopsis sp. MPI-PUGE-AT-0042]
MQFTALAALAAPALLWVSGAAAASGFAESCTDPQLVSQSLFATCKNGTILTGVSLDFCIGIGATNLECVRGGQFLTLGCNTCEITMGTEMRCECPGGPKAIDLNTCIGLTPEETLTC